MMKQWTLIVPADLMSHLEGHLFPGDGDEHGAVIAAGLVETERGTRLLARDLFLAKDGIDYVPGQRGYRMLTASFVRDKVLYCRDERLVYLAIHCHGGTDRVGFSGDDLASHERGYPALLDVARGQPVGALVFARNAVAGDIWLPGGERVALTSARVVGRATRSLYPEPPPKPPRCGPAYDRQARLFGDKGQAILSDLKVGIIGAGGAGSLLVEYLSRVGVGHLIVADPDRLEESNLPRVVGSSAWNVLPWLTDGRRPGWMRRIGERLSAKKVRIAERVAKRANPRIRFEGIDGNIVDETVAHRFVDCDYLFLAADSMQARLVFNSLVHQYLIPGVQVGAKVLVDKATGDILDVFSVFRPVTPDSGCLWCNEVISSAKLQEEALTKEERRAQNYVDDPDVKAPSVITMNAVATSLAANDFLFAVTGLLEGAATGDYIRALPRMRDFRFDQPRKSHDCIECGPGEGSRLARGDSYRLPIRPPSRG